MLEVEEQQTSDDTEQKSMENTETMSTDAEVVTKETESAADTPTEDVAKQQSTTTDEAVAVVTPAVDEKGDASKGDAKETESSDKPPVTEAGDAKINTGICIFIVFVVCSG